MRTRTTTLAILIFCISIASVPLQSQTTNAQKLSFEVASIRPFDLSKAVAAHDTLVAGWRCHGVDSRLVPGDTPPAPLGRCIFRLSLKELTGIAYAPAPHPNAASGRVTGGPSWVDSDRWDIQAKAEDVNVTEAQLRQMLQTLLVERFALQFHQEEKQVSGYALLIGKGGTRLVEDTSEARGSMTMTGGVLNFKRYPLSVLISYIEDYVDGPVVNQTGLAGLYTFDFQPPPRQTTSIASDSPSIFTAVQEQLGLRLEPQKVMQDILVIDHAERPTAN